VFELVKTGTNTYAGSLITVASFNGGSNGANPTASLIADATSNLFGTTYSGGTG
jgi:hypothetical protein